MSADSSGSKTIVISPVAQNRRETWKVLETLATLAGVVLLKLSFLVAQAPARSSPLVGGQGGPTPAPDQGMYLPPWAHPALDHPFPSRGT